MEIKTAIEKAIEGGWNSDYELEYICGFNDDGIMLNHKTDGGSRTLIIYEIYLDPLFWQGLGKAMEWKGTTYIQMGQIINELTPDWKYHWHRFIDHLAKRKTIESFFNELTYPLNPPKTRFTLDEAKEIIAEKKGLKKEDVIIE